MIPAEATRPVMLMSQARRIAYAATRKNTTAAALDSNGSVLGCTNLNLSGLFFMVPSVRRERRRPKPAQTKINRVVIVRTMYRSIASLKSRRFVAMIKPTATTVFLMGRCRISMRWSSKSVLERKTRRFSDPVSTQSTSRAPETNNATITSASR
jgi:hypothetical protein